MNGSEGGWILYFRAGREVKAIREDCPPENHWCYLALRFDNQEVIFDDFPFLPRRAATTKNILRLSSGSSLPAEMNGSEGGWILYFRAGREVKAIREDCPPGKEEGKKALPSISTSFPRRWKSILAQRITGAI
ncbi:unnamed protein product [Lactuca saligna]|uniref:Uncharacterized protein n=1 Tax=Lactuca saligna TaxID=75948 RepID=A0AA35Z8S2_LACSI|nr:unnamed protein product [Lactuca saligna]